MIMRRSVFPYKILLAVPNNTKVVYYTFRTKNTKFSLFVRVHFLFVRSEKKILLLIHNYVMHAEEQEDFSCILFPLVTIIVRVSVKST
jgi:hypothetical protein